MVEQAEAARDETLSSSFIALVSISKMKSPFDDIDKSFLPFFTDAFAVATKSGKKTTLHVSLFIDATDTPIADMAMETERRVVSMVCNEDDWPWVKENLARGDSLTDVKTQRKYSVTSVEDDAVIGKIIHAREC